MKQIPPSKRIAWVTIKSVMPSAASSRDDGEHLGNQFGVKCGGDLVDGAPVRREELHDRKGIMVRIASRFASKAGATR